MDHFCQKLTNSKQSLGHKTSKSFYNYLKDHGLECNYQYFIKIESGKVIPTSTIVNQIAKALPSEHSEIIIRTYCSMLFSDHAYLFDDSLQDQVKPTTQELLQVNQGQKELTLLQVHTIAKTKNHYYLFLILTLSRRPIDLNELKDFSQIGKILKDLKNSEIITVNNEMIEAKSQEFVFPKVGIDLSLAAIFTQLDVWDIQLPQEFAFTKLVNKSMIRRISPRYANVMLKQIDAFTEFVRCSDEFNQKYNSDVISLQINLSLGKLPG